MVRDQLIPRLLSATEAAEVLGVARSHVHRLINDGKLPAGYAGATLVLAEETVLRYKAGERFPQPSQLRVSIYDEAVDRWVPTKTIPVKPEYEFPLEFKAEELGFTEGQQFRVELLDINGKIMKVTGPHT